MNKRRLALWLCALLLAGASLLRCADDRYLLTYNGYELAGEAHGNADGTATVTGGADTFTTPALWLAAGRYELVLDYAADEAGSSLTAESERTLNPDNTLGYRYAEAGLDPGATQLVVQLELYATVRDLRVAVDYGGAGALTLNGLTVRSSPVFYKDHIFLAALVLLLCLGVDIYLFRPAMRLRKNQKPGDTFEARLARLAPFVCVAGLGLLASYPLFASILPAGHDLDFHLARIHGIADGMASGQFPVRVYPTQLNGKGYLLGVMYPDLFLWPSAVLRLCGVSLMGAYKALVVALNVGTAGAAYWAGRRLFPGRRFAAACVAVLYTLAPYRILNVHNRAALGEALAMAFLPLVAAGLYDIFFGEREKWPVAVLGYTGLVQSHVLSLATAGAFSVLLGLAFLYRLLREKARLFSLLKAAGWTLLLNLWWLAPFVWFSATQPFGIFATVPEIWLSALTPAQLFMGEVAGGALAPQMQLGLGIPLILAFGVLLLWLVFGRQDALPARLRSIGWGCLGFGALALWLCTEWFPWRLLARVPVLGPAVSSLQFPWRFLGLGTLFLALCGGAVAAFAATGGEAACGAVAPRAAPRPASLLTLALLVALCMPAAANIMDAALNNPDAKTLTDAPNTNHTYDGQYLYVGSDDVMLVAWGDDIKSDSEPEISNYTKDGLSVTFTYAMNGAEYLDLPLTWYPGYTGAENARSPEGLVRIAPAQESGTLTVEYRGLWWYRAGDVLSLLGLAAFIALPAVKKRVQKRRATPKESPQ